MMFSLFPFPSFISLHVYCVVAQKDSEEAFETQ